MKKKILKSTKKDEVLIVLEKMNDNIGIIAEGQQFLKEEMNRRFDDSDKNINDFKDEMFGFSKGMYSFRDEMYKFRDDTKANFKAILEHQFNTDDRLESIEKELKEIKSEIKEMKKKSNLDEGWVALIEKRIGFIEKQLKLQKQMAR
jgi:predicted  nucleic acid-binding Zn-ribbon protein